MRQARSRYLRCSLRVAVTTLRRPPHRARGGHDLLTRSSMSGHPDPFRSVRDLGPFLACLFMLVRRTGRSFVRVAPDVAPTAPSPARSVCGLRSAIAGRSDREPSSPGRARFALGAVGTICHRGSQPVRSSCHHRSNAGQPGPGAVVARRASYRPVQASARYLGGHSPTRREAGGARRPGEPLPLCRSSLRCGGDLDVLPLRHYADQEVALAARHSVRGARRQQRRGAPGVAGREDLVRGKVGSDPLLGRLGVRVR
jgi:hypothetical protein